MLKINNMGSVAFRRYIKDKRIYVFGAGRAFSSCADIYFENKKIHRVVDSNPKLQGKRILHKGRQIPIVSVEEFTREIAENGIDTASLLFISSAIYAVEIVEELDGIPELDGMECFVQYLVQNTKESIKGYEFTQGRHRIPKTIHYIWVGGKEMPDEYRRFIGTWKEHSPEYELKRWDESNYDFSKCDYMKEAYECGAWGFVPNFARLDIIYEHGGIYLDTDVEVLKSMECLLNDDAFLGMTCADRVSNGCGFGAVAGHPLIGEMKARFESMHFTDRSGKAERISCSAVLRPVLRKWGFKNENQYQNINGVALYPAEVFSPLTPEGMENFFSEKTISVHHQDGTWRKQREKHGLSDLRRLLSRLGRDRI